MVSFDDAMCRARALKPNIDNCMEYEDAYVFASHADDLSFGGDGPVVILKDSGRAINMVDYTQETKNTALLRRYEL